ncbi:DUF3488 and transglutaminase-like domain-containing protein [Kribbella yunnanensis]|uniref:DUF3488 and transglutaminase-like domain-containing protein n=1 Tax=Kribbella yunnanensis TaxID=190194 RepID=A0ABP4T6P1_9ACTN
MTGHARISLAAWGATVLGSLVLTPVFSGPFLFISAFLCAIVTGVGVLLQNLRAPRVVVPVVQLIVLVELISLFFLKETMKFGLVPTGATAIEFNSQLVSAMSSINQYSAPLPPDDNLLLFATTVISATGLLIHVIAVQIRQAAWAGLLLLIMYTVPAATVHGGLPALLFIPPAIGYIVLLSAEGRSRLSRWGRRISGVSHLDAAEPVEASALGQAGRRIGLSVVALAAILPALLPTLPEGVIGNGLGGGGTGGTGLGASISTTDPMLDMGKNLKRPKNDVALTYKGGPSGGTYLRLTSLDQFDGNTWRISDRKNRGRKIEDELVPPPGFTGDLARVQKVKMEIDVNKVFRSQFAPIPYPAQSISLRRNWQYDASSLDVSSTDGAVVSGKKYTVTAYDLRPTEEQLRDAISRGAPDEISSRLPRNVPPRITDLTRQITADANGNKYLMAVALQKWFRTEGGYTYSTTNQRGSGMKAIEDFLLENKTGYCEQFATGMALMARIAGIPSRVGIGFLPGQAGANGQYTVRMHDMHAWPELYFESVGWVRFEPTPASRVASTPEWTIPSSNPTSPTTAPTTAPTTPGQTEDPGIEKPENGRNLNDDNGAAAFDSGNWFTNGGARTLGIAAIVVLVLLIPWILRSLNRRRRYSRAPSRVAAEGLWSEVRDTSRDLGLDWNDVSTPRQTGEWLVTKLPDEAHPSALRLARSVEAMRYAGQADVATDLRPDVTVIRKALWKQAPARRRWRARLLPASWRWYLSRGTTEASDLLDEFDLLLARLRSTILRRRHAN